jgi:hypothetical protein
MGQILPTQTKHCSRCETTKSIDNFYKRSGRDGYQGWCKTCNNLGRVTQTRANRRKAIEFLGGKCTRCLYNRYDGALHFHHPNPSLKDDMFHRLRNRKWDYIRQILIDQKIVLLCSNCHAEEHASQHKSRPGPHYVMDSVR